MDMSNPKTCWNIQQSAFKAGIGRTLNAAHVEGCKLLQNPTVQTAIRKQGEDLGLAWEQVTRRLNAMITTSISDVLWWDEEAVHLRPFEEIPEEVRWAIESITETQTPMGPGRRLGLGIFYWGRDIHALAGAFHRAARLLRIAGHVVCGEAPPGHFQGSGDDPVQLPQPVGPGSRRRRGGCFGRAQRCLSHDQRKEQDD
jgi:hypothetical protein